MGVAIVIQKMFVREVQQGRLVPLFEWHDKARIRRCLLTAPAAQRTTEVQVFRDWTLQLAAANPSDPSPPPSLRPPLCIALP